MKKHRNKDAASSQLQFCFTGDELLRYRTGKIPSELRSRIFNHLNIEKCRRCRALYVAVQEPPIDGAPAKRNTRMIEKLQREMGKHRAQPVPLRLAKFQIWTTSPEPKNHRGEVVASIPMAVPVLIISAGNKERTLENIIRVLPLSNDTDFHLEGETLVIAENSPLKYPFLVEIFNESPMLAGNLGEYRGVVSQTQSAEILLWRDRYLDDVTIKPDQPYREWKRKELALTRYLALPVNEGIWELPTHDAIVDVFLVPYRRAANAGGMDLSELRPHILVSEDRFTLAIVQKGDRVLLRFLSDALIPEIFIDDNEIGMDKKMDGLFEAVIGYTPEMPETIKIKAVIDSNPFVFNLRFRENSDE